MEKMKGSFEFAVWLGCKCGKWEKKVSELAKNRLDDGEEKEKGHPENRAVTGRLEQAFCVDME